MFLIRIDNSPRRLVRAEDDRMKHVLKRKSGKFEIEIENFVLT